MLRRARETRGLSLHDASRTTRIHRRFLEALEEDAGVDAFPGDAYERFFLREYARYLEMDDQILVTALEERTPSPQQILRVPPELRPPRRWVGTLVRAAAVFSLLGLAGYSVVTAQGERPAVSRTTTSTAPGANTPTTGPAAATNPEAARSPIRLSIRVDSPTFVRVYADGRREVDRIVQPRHLVIGASDRVSVRIDNGSAVRLSVNGDRVATASAAPFIRRFVFSKGHLTTS